jgi:hypothetical protein
MRMPVKVVPPSNMSEDIAKWLEEHGLGRYIDVFKSNEIDVADLSPLTEDHLRKPGLPMGPRMRLLSAAAEVVPIVDEGSATGSQPSDDADSASPVTGDWHSCWSAGDRQETAKVKWPC